MMVIMLHAGAPGAWVRRGYPCRTSMRWSKSSAAPNMLVQVLWGVHWVLHSTGWGTRPGDARRIRSQDMKEFYKDLDRWKGNPRKHLLWKMMARKRAYQEVSEREVRYGMQRWKAPRPRNPPGLCRRPSCSPKPVERRLSSSLRKQIEHKKARLSHGNDLQHQIEKLRH